MSVSCECSVYFQVGVCLIGPSLSQMSPVKCGVSERDLANASTRKPRSTTAVEP